MGLTCQIMAPTPTSGRWLGCQSSPCYQLEMPPNVSEALAMCPALGETLVT